MTSHATMDLPTATAMMTDLVAASRALARASKTAEKAQMQLAASGGTAGDGTPWFDFYFLTASVCRLAQDDRERAESVRAYSIRHAKAIRSRRAPAIGLNGASMTWMPAGARDTTPDWRLDAVMFGPGLEEGAGDNEGWGIASKRDRLWAAQVDPKQKARKEAASIERWGLDTAGHIARFGRIVGDPRHAPDAHIRIMPCDGTTFPEPHPGPSRVVFGQRGHATYDTNVNFEAGAIRRMAKIGPDPKPRRRSGFRGVSMAIRVARMNAEIRGPRAPRPVTEKTAMDLLMRAQKALAAVALMRDGVTVKRTDAANAARSLAKAAKMMGIAG